MPLETLVCELAGEPYCLPLEAIGRLTRWQVNHIYYHPRNKDGQPTRDPGGSGPSPKEEFFARCKRHGLNEARARQLWRERVARIKANRRGEEG